jgi:hypothetical protein
MNVLFLLMVFVGITMSSRNKDTSLEDGVIKQDTKHHTTLQVQNRLKNILAI